MLGLKASDIQIWYHYSWNALQMYRVGQTNGIIKTDDFA